MSIHNLPKTLWLVPLCLIVLLLAAACDDMEGADDDDDDNTIKTGNVIFLHPDGTGGAMWHAMRDFVYGPDSVSNWDRMERMALYRSHVLNSTNSSSHGGATIHSYGIKVLFDTYGNPPERNLTALSGKKKSIMHEAIEAGMSTALINSGHICEPGTGVFVASSLQRSATDTISEQIINSGVDIILSGGEKLLLPEGVKGRYGEGIRKDGKNLIEQAEANGYTVVYNREELLALPSDVDKVLGVFAAGHTFNDWPEEQNRENDRPLYWDWAPTLSEMTETALRILEAKGKQFLMVVEEEATDNFGNANNASGELEALRRTDETIGVVMGYMDQHPNTLLVTAADSEAGGFQIVPIRDSADFNKPLPLKGRNGAPIDGVSGTGSIPFTAKPDKKGVELRFGVAWACYGDVAGSVLARAHGINSWMMGNDVDNTDIYRMMYATLFGKVLPTYRETH